MCPISAVTSSDACVKLQQVRITGEDPLKDFQPCPGILGEVFFPTDIEGVRVDTWVATGTEVCHQHVAPGHACLRRGWQPAGVVMRVALPQHYTSGVHVQVSVYYDSLLAKLMVWAPSREAAIAKMQERSLSLL